MGVAISVFPAPYQDDVLHPMVRKKVAELKISKEEVKGDSPFDKLLVYPVLLPDRRKNQRLVKDKSTPRKPIIMYGHLPEKQPMVIELKTVFKNLDTAGELEKNSTVLSSLLVAQYEDVDYDVTVNYAYGFSQTTGKCYFYKEGNFDRLMSRINHDTQDYLPYCSRKIFLSQLHKLMNTMAGSVWLNGYCINGPENPQERIPIESIRVRNIPARVTISVKELDGIHVIRTKTRLEVYGKMEDDTTKSIWFRGPFANSLIVTEVKDGFMSVLIPPYCQESIAVRNDRLS